MEIEETRNQTLVNFGLLRPGETFYHGQVHYMRTDAGNGDKRAIQMNSGRLTDFTSACMVYKTKAKMSVEVPI